MKFKVGDILAVVNAGGGFNMGIQLKILSIKNEMYQYQWLNHYFAQGTISWCTGSYLDYGYGKVNIPNYNKYWAKLNE